MGHHKTNTPASHYNKMIFTVNIAKEAPKNLVVKDKWKKIRSIWKKETRDLMEEIFSDSSKPDLPGSNLAPCFWNFLKLIFSRISLRAYLDIW